MQKHLQIIKHDMDKNISVDVVKVNLKALYKLQEIQSKILNSIDVSNDVSDYGELYGNKCIDGNYKGDSKINLKLKEL